MAGKSLSSVDTTWLRMEQPSNLMTITGVIAFGRPMDFDRLKATLEHRLVGRFDRFRQCVIEPLLPLGVPRWEEDAHFDINYHLQRLRLPPPGDQAALQDVVSLLMSTQLDFSRPLWQMHLAEDYGQGSALIIRLHHCIADGIALMHVLFSLTDQEPDVPWPMADPPHRQRKRAIPAMLGVAVRTARALTHAGGTWRPDQQRADLARLAGNGLESAARLVFRWPDPPTLLKGRLGVPKRAAWSEPIPVKDVKSIGRAIGATVNDVLLAAMAGALHRYLEESGEVVEGLNIRAIVPVNLRPAGSTPDLGNRFSLFFLSLPVGETDPIQRLLELKRRMDAIKRSAEAPLVYGGMAVIGLAPKPLQDAVVTLFGAKASAVMTNVAGPAEKRYMAGCPLDSLMFWVPQSGRLGLGVSIISYAGQVWVGVAADAGLVPDPGQLISAFKAEFETLHGLAQQNRSQSGQIVKTMLDTLDNTIQSLDDMMEGVCYDGTND